MIARLALALLLLPLSLPSLRAEAARIRVSQESRPGAGDFNRHILGFILSYPGKGKSAAELYAYDEPAYASYNGAHPRLRSDTSHLFFVETKEGLSLFIVHDRPNDEDGGGAHMRLELEGDPGGAKILFYDDPFSENDFYEEPSQGAVFSTQHYWLPCCTDGLILGTLEGKWRLYVQFTLEGLEPFDGMSSWVAFSANGSKIPLALEKGRRVRLEPNELVVRPQAPTDALPAGRQSPPRRRGTPPPPPSRRCERTRGLRRHLPPVWPPEMKEGNGWPCPRGGPPPGRGRRAGRLGGAGRHARRRMDVILSITSGGRALRMPRRTAPDSSASRSSPRAASRKSVRRRARRPRGAGGRHRQPPRPGPRALTAEIPHPAARARFGIDASAAAVPPRLSV